MSAPLDLRAVDVWVHDKWGEVGDGREYVVALLAALRATRAALEPFAQRAKDVHPESEGASFYFAAVTYHRAVAVLAQVVDG